MKANRLTAGVSAERLTASVFGVLAGVGGLTHGLGEIQQGRVAPAGLVIKSWVEGPIATHMDGDPALTVLPTIWAAGVVTIIVSLATALWAAAFVHRPNGGLILILLSVGLLLVGGGFAPPLVGILAGAAGTLIRAPLRGWRTRLSSGARQALARLWPWVFGLGVADMAFLLVGALFLIYFFGLGSAGLFLGSFLFGVLALLLTIVTGAAHDAELREHGSAA